MTSVAVICRILAVLVLLVAIETRLDAATPVAEQRPAGSGAMDRLADRLKSLGQRGGGNAKLWKGHREAGRKAEKKLDLAEAEQHYAAAAREAEGFSPKDERIAESLEDWGRIVFQQRKFRQSQRVFEDLVMFRERTLGSNHLSLLSPLLRAAQSASFVGRFDVAEAAYLRALDLAEVRLGAYHMGVGQIWGALGQGYEIAGKPKEAEAAFMKALAILQAPKSRFEATNWELTRYVQRPDYLAAASVMNDLAVLYRRQGRAAEAESTFQKALAHYEREAGKKSEGAAMVLDNLGDFYREQKNFSQAEASLSRALSIREKLLGPDHLLVADTLQSMALLNIDQGKQAEAARLGERVQSIRAQVSGGIPR